MKNHNWTDCWLAYPLIREEAGRTVTVASDFDGAVVFHAFREFARGMSGLYQRTVEPGVNADVRFVRDDTLHPEGYRVRAAHGTCEIRSGGASGILYGVFALLRRLQTEQCSFDELAWETEAAPSNALRMLIHWDNLPGDIERGYAGRSLFFADNEVLVNERTAAYARLAASVGINGVVINNSNVEGAAAELITPRYFPALRRMQEVFAGWGIRLFLSVEFTAPMLLGGLDSADPCAGPVLAWWKKKADEVWNALPGLGGFMVKADSEGREGPHSYGRTHADGANALADAVAPHGGTIIWRCFVYNCQQDWRDTGCAWSRARPAASANGAGRASITSARMCASSQHRRWTVCFRSMWRMRRGSASNFPKTCPRSKAR